MQCVPVPVVIRGRYSVWSRNNQISAVHNFKRAQNFVPATQTWVGDVLSGDKGLGDHTLPLDPSIYVFVPLPSTQHHSGPCCYSSCWLRGQSSPQSLIGYNSRRFHKSSSCTAQYTTRPGMLHNLPQTPGLQPSLPQATSLLQP